MENTEFAPSTPLSEDQAAAEARRIIAEAYRPDPTVPAATSYRDHTPVPAIGPTPPVELPDQRIVPQWAAGVAVASIGVGLGVTGLGCGAWLVLQALASVTIWSVLAIVAPFAGIATVTTAVGSAVSKARASSSTHIYKGTVVKTTQVTTHTKGMFSRTRTELHG